MTRRRRWMVGGGLGSLMAFVGVVGPWPLDSTPEAGPAAKALSIVAAEGRALRSEHAAASAKPFLAGWAFEPFAMPEGVPLAGYGARRGAASTGTLPGEVLGARVVAMRCGEGPLVVVVCADLLLVNQPLADAVREELRKIYPDVVPVVMFTATHTHSGPGGFGEMALEEMIAGRFDPLAFTGLRRAMVGGVKSAIDSLSPAEYAWIDSDAAEYLRNRTVKGGEVDGTLEALVIRRSGGVAATPQTAVLALFGAHATCLSDDNLLLSADYPGAMVRALEADSRIDFAAFAGNCPGSQTTQAEGNGRQRLEFVGEGLAERVLTDFDDLEFRSKARLSTREFELPTPDLQVRVGASWRLSPVATGLIHQPRATLTVLRIDDRLWAGVPFEVSGMLSKPLRERAARSGLDGLTLSNFSGDYLGYLIPDELYLDGEVYESQMNFLGPGGGTFFIELMRCLIESQKPRAGSFDSL